VSDTFLGYLLSSMALMLFTSGILLTKVAAGRMNLALGFLIATTTNVVFSALAFIVQLAMRPEALQWNGRAFLLFGIAGGFSTYLGRWFFYEAVVRFGPSRASVFQVSSPLFTALIAWLLLGEHLTPLLLLGMAVTISGLILVSYKPGALSGAGKAFGAPGSTSTRERLLQSMLLLGLGSSLAYAVGNVLRGTGVRLWNEPILGALAGSVFGLALQFATSPDKRGIWANLRKADSGGVWLFVLIGIGTISAQICAIAAMRYIPLSVATLVTLCTPILVFPLSRMLFKNSEGIGRPALIGCCMTLLGIFMVVMR
jgi:drug/metabolite transporter (DMT)-like permease